MKQKEEDRVTIIPEYVKLESGRKGLDIGYDEFVGGDRSSLEGSQLVMNIFIHQIKLSTLKLIQKL